MGTHIADRDTSTNQGGHTVLKVLVDSIDDTGCRGCSQRFRQQRRRHRDDRRDQQRPRPGGEPPSNSAVGVTLDSEARSPARCPDATINLSTGVRIAGTETEVNAIAHRAAVGLETSASGTVSAAASHLQVTASSAGVIMTTGVVTIEDALFIARRERFPPSGGMNAVPPTSHCPRHVTMVVAPTGRRVAALKVAPRATRGELP